ncbi:MAG: phage major capsid protein [Hyphomicrobiales bacterium]|nr:phage major capsid protein [Hyphomicrobiales bacterium]
MSRNALETATLALEHKNEGGADKGVLDQITREIKQFGGDLKGLKDSMEKDLHDVRKVAEEAKGAAAETPEVKKLIETVQLSVTEKHAAIEKIVKDLQEQADRVETAMKRKPLGGPDADKDETKHAVSFFEAKAAAAGNLAWQNRPNAETADIEGYRSWAKNYETYLRSKDERAIEQKALSVGSNPDGGYLVPTARSARIITRVYESSPIRQLATVETIGTSELEIPIDIDEADAGWVGETEARPETGNPDLGLQRIPVHEIYAKPRASQKFLEDASVDVEAWIDRKVSEKMARVEATAFVIGNGVNKPRGILTYPAGSAGDRKTILQYASGGATTITADAIVGMPFQIKSEYLANSVWLMKRSTVAAVMLLKDGQGQYLWRPALQPGQPSILGGHAVNMADDMPIIGAGNLPIAFGDFQRGYTVVDRLGITVLRDPYSAKPLIEFYTRKRVGGDVTDFEAFALMTIAAS